MLYIFYLLVLVACKAVAYSAVSRIFLMSRYFSLLSPWDAIMIDTEVKISKIFISGLAEIAFLDSFFYPYTSSLPSFLLPS